MTPGKPADDATKKPQEGGPLKLGPERTQGTADSALPLDSATAEAVDETMDFEQEIDGLPADQKILALLNIRHPVEVVTIPEPFRAVTITIPRKNLGAASEHLDQLGLGCSSDFAGDDEDEDVNLTYIIPHQETVNEILLKFKSASIPAQITAASNRTMILRIEGKKAISLHSKLNDRTTVQAPTALGEQGKANLNAAEIDTSSGHETALQIPKKPEDDTIPAKFLTAHATPTSLAIAKDEAEKEPRIPRKGSCSYMMIDQNFLDDKNTRDTNVRQFMDEINLIRESQNFHITSYNGYLVIIGTSERAASSLAAMATRFYRATGSTHIFLGTGKIDHKQQGKFSVTGFPKTEERTEWNNTYSGVYLTEEFETLIKDPTKRDSALCKIKTAKTDNPKLARLIEFLPKPSLRIGGPDRLIGYTEEEERLLKAATDGRTKLTILKGNAGMGKSRLLEEVIAKLPAATVCSLDPSGSKTPGFAMMTVVEQIAAKFHDEENSNLLNLQAAKDLIQLTRLPQNEKIKLAQSKPTEIIGTCLRALEILNKGATPFVLDDIHHADRFSMPHLMTLAHRYMTECDGKAILAMRPEEIYEPEAVRKLVQDTHSYYGREGSSTEIKLEGLDFSNDEIARQFVFYSLPESIREGKTIESLGPWYKDLATVAVRQPLVMKTLMDGILEDLSDNIDASGEVIILKGKISETIKKILSKESDLKTYYNERLQKLKKGSLKLLQCIALMGGRIDATELGAVARNVSGLISSDRFRASVKELVDHGYIFVRDSGSGKQDTQSKTIELQHETTRDIVVDSIETDDVRLNLSKKLYDQFKNDPKIHQDTRFGLAHNVATSPSTPAEDDAFWSEYAEIAEESLQDAKRLNAVDRGYHIAKTILDKEMGSARVRSAIEQLKNPEAKSLPPLPVIRIAIAAMHALAKNAIFIGRFEETDEVVADLETIQTLHPEIDVNLLEAYKVLFEKAYLQGNIRQMREVYKDKLQNGELLDQADRAIAEIRIRNKTQKFEDVRPIFDANHQALTAKNETHKREHGGAPSPVWVEAFRLAYARCPFEAIRKEAQKDLDQDVEMQAGLTSLEQVGILFNIKEALEHLKAIRAEFPLTFNPYEELALLEQIGSMHGYFGDYESASAALAETWRQADQMKVHGAGARIAKIKGDSEVMRAICTTNMTPTRHSRGSTQARKVVDRKYLRKAIKTYSTEGMTSLANITDRTDIYHQILRIQRVRAVGILVTSYENELNVAKSETDRERIRIELADDIKKALNDFKELNTTSAQILVSNPDKPTEAWHNDPDPCYYLMGYMGHILEMATELNIPLDEEMKDPAKYPFLRRSSIQRGISFSKNLKDNGVGEIDRKTNGFNKADKFAIAD